MKLSRLASIALATFLLAAPLWSESLAVRGRVRTAEGENVSGARVELVPMVSRFREGLLRLEGRSRPPAVIEGRTDASGHFTVLAPEPGMWKVIVSSRGRVPMEHRLVPLLEEIDLPTLSLGSDAGARVTIRDGKGKPVEGAWLAARSSSTRGWQGLRRAGWRPERRLGRTDAKGVLKLPRLRGEKLSILAFAPGYDEAEATDVEGASMSLTRGERRSQSVLARDQGDSALSGALVRVGRGAWPVGQTDEEGQVVLAVAAGSMVSIQVELADGRSQRERLQSRASSRLIVDLPALVTVAGMVLDAARREPLGGALVWPDRDPTAWVRTDPKGQYSLSIPAESRAGRATLQAVAQRYLPQRAEALVDSDRGGPTLALEPAAGVSGWVVDEGGEPISEVEVQSQARVSFHTGTARTDGGGRFRLGSLGTRGPARIRFSKPGFAPAVETVAGLRGGETRSGLEVVLRRGRSVLGRVVDPDQVPLSGAEIILRGTGDPRPVTSAVLLSLRGMELAAAGNRGMPGSGGNRFPTSDAQGAFEARNVPAGTFDLQVQRSGFAPTVVRGLEVPPGTGEADVGTIVLVPGLTIEGVVTDAEGEPLEGAEVRQVRNSLGRFATSFARNTSIETDAEGTFSLVDLLSGEKLTLWISLDGYRTAELLGVEAPTTEPLAVVLGPAFQVSGRVVDQEGTPVEEATVVARAESSGRRMRMVRSGPSDAEGRFTLAGIEPGRILITSSRQGYAQRQALVAEVPSDGDLDGLEVVLHRGSATVQGQVLGSGGVPLVGARITTRGTRATADGDGFYVLKEVALGPQTVRVSGDGLSSSRSLIVEPGVNQLDLELEGQSVSGTVLDPVGAPVEGAVVRVMGVSQRFGQRRNVQSSADGSFTASGVSDGLYRVMASKAGFADGESDEVRVTGASVSGVEIRLQTGGSVVGRVLGLEFDELARVRVNANGRHGRGSGVVKYDGEYRISELAPGEWTVSARLDQRQIQEQIRLEPGADEAVVDLEFGRGLTLSGQVRSDGEPLTPARVRLTGIDLTAGGSTSTDYRGDFRFSELKPGAYRVSVSGHSEEIELGEDRSIVIDIVGLEIGGRVIDEATSEALSGVRVSISVESQERTSSSVSSSLSDSEGRFLLRRISAGSYRLGFKRGGYERAEQVIELTAGLDVDNLQIVMRPTQGLVLQLQPAGGALPQSVYAAVLGRDGIVRLADQATRDSQGQVRFPSIPAGTSDLLVGASGYATTRIRVEVPGPPVPLTLPMEGWLEVLVPDLVSSQVIATLSLTGPNGEPVYTLNRRQPLKEWRLRSGRVSLGGLLPGAWTVHVETTDGRLWTSSVQTSTGQLQKLTLQ